jgi:hypothetical protein
MPIGVLEFYKNNLHVLSYSPSTFFTYITIGTKLCSDDKKTKERVVENNFEFDVVPLFIYSCP